MELSLNTLKKNYGTKEALKGVSLSLSPGIYGLLGPNGAGKSTLMNILVGNLAATSGEILLDGKSVFAMGRGYREQLGYMPQQQSLYPTFTAVRFLSYMASLKGMSREEAKQQIPDVLNRVGLLDVANKRIRGFSGGMKQRLLIAQAILGNPSILILDEPTAGLDPKQRIAIRNLIAEIALDRIVIIATHVVSDVEFIARRMILLCEGEIIAEGTREELTGALYGRVLELDISLEQLPEVSETYQVGNIIREGDRLFVRVLSSGQEIPYTYQAVRPNLEDVYLHYFGE